MALKLRYGKSEEGNVQYFHSLLHKLIPVNSHAFPPALTEDGVFVNAVVKLDVKANRFVPLSHFEETKVPRLAIIYLSWKDSTLKVGVYFCRSPHHRKVWTLHFVNVCLSIIIFQPLAGSQIWNTMGCFPKFFPSLGLRRFWLFRVAFRYW